jgi:hypothetical protein
MHALTYTMHDPCATHIHHIICMPHMSCLACPRMSPHVMLPHVMFPHVMLPHAPRMSCMSNYEMHVVMHVTHVMNTPHDMHAPTYTMHDACATHIHHIVCMPHMSCPACRRISPHVMLPHVMPPHVMPPHIPACHACLIMRCMLSCM